MKIKTKTASYEEVLALPKPKKVRPKKPLKILSFAMKAISQQDLKDVNFKYTKERMEEAGDGPWIMFMNHSSFLDLEIVSEIMYPKPYSIVCTSDGFVGKEGLMRSLGCIPTQKFVTDLSLVADIAHSLKANNTSLLMYPEASYSFDGTTTPLPRKLGVLLKKLKVPVVMITTYGSFTRDPLYNNLQKRKLDVTAKMECLISKEELSKLSVQEIDDILDKAFDLDYFKWQKDNNIVINEDFRADGLNRILYKCACCKTEGQMIGKGTSIKCNACGKEYFLDELGSLHAKEGETEFSHIPDWYAWERNEVLNDINNNSYSLDTDVEIGMIVDTKALYMVGSGHLHHDANGFVLDGCDGKLHYEQGPKACYSLYADYFWYEIGDVICIGTKDILYYCFPKKQDIVAKTRLAVEEIYKNK